MIKIIITNPMMN